MLFKAPNQISQERNNEMLVVFSMFCGDCVEPVDGPRCSAALFGVFGFVLVLYSRYFNCFAIAMTKHASRIMLNVTSAASRVLR